MNFKIDIFKIREQYDKDIKNEITKIKDIKLNNFIKTISILKKKKTTLIIIQNNNNSMLITILNNSLYNSLYFQNSITSLINLYKDNNISDSTCFDSKSNISINNDSIIEYIPELKFNSIRSNFYSKYNLYDVPIGQIIINYNHPPKFRINET